MGPAGDCGREFGCHYRFAVPLILTECDAVTFVRRRYPRTLSRQPSKRRAVEGSPEKRLESPSNCMYNIVMIYEWDEAKNAANIIAGRLGFEVIEDFDWETAIITSSPRRGENRLAALGLIADKLYQVVYIRREGRRRIISLRLASRKERDRYVHERARDTHSDR